MEKLMIMLKVLSDNFRILHRNLTGNNFHGTHELFGEFYDKMDEIQDDVCEIAISLGYDEPTLGSIVGSPLPYPSLPKGMKYDSTRAFEFAYNYFIDLMKEFESIKDTVPADVYAHFEEYIYWLRKEANYKIKRRLGM